MSTFTIFPAIDLKSGWCVRLRQGDPNESTVYSKSPAEIAMKWESQGAEWLHVVNLDGAMGQDASYLNKRALREIREAVGLPIQFGGGIRSLKDILQAIELGASRVVLGTLAVEKPEEVRESIDYFGADKIVVGIDARDGMVAIHGWQETTEVPAIELAKQMAEIGVERIVYTDIARDGMLSGINVGATERIARESGLKVIASGGVAGIADIEKLLRIRESGVEGVIIGQALYTGSISLPEALEVARNG